MKKSAILNIALAVLMTMFIAAPQVAEAGSKGGHYAGGKSSSHKGGSYVPPYGRRYSK